ncbi:hypothetical protein C8J36_101595 [Rhizobium sp. PP-F2F-G48]|uniref:NUDIX hydrolase n=1 Tax=Rhizobium sp. PP-F2F-G48 TaxID=2135651 RepID=UPI0010D7B0DC|nr:NUDIX hydrolase [Rhizobium sp. PP-F2F-G48]TCM58688.1 hypothetical protein C8J36_101595 [Rhizobium sp. PP-F2F-G48]
MSEMPHIPPASSSGIADGWPGEGVIFPVTGIDLRVLPGPHPVIAQHGPDIAQNWEREHAANPALFNGEMVLQHRLTVRSGTIVGEGYLAPYAAFLWWRSAARPPVACHLAAVPVIETSDGAVIAVRMGAHTANPGKIYCAAGSIDASDLVEDARGLVCDVPGNMRREVLEETGLDIGEAVPGPFEALQMSGSATLFRRLRFAETSASILSRIARHVETADDDEIDGAVAIFDADPQAHNYQPFMRVILAHIFGRHR